jgi:hypothetical protein
MRNYLTGGFAVAPMSQAFKGIVQRILTGVNTMLK